jgi:exoribonuclease II
MNRCRKPLSLIMEVNHNGIVSTNFNFWSRQIEAKRKITATDAVSDNAFFVEAVSDVALRALST